MRKPFTLVCALVVACGGGDSHEHDHDARGAAVDAAPGSPDAADDAPPFDAPPPRNPLTGAGSATLVDGGYQFLEGPVWRANDGVLLFSDIPGNTIYQLTPPSTIVVFRADSGNANGLVEDTAGLLLAAEHGNRRVSRTQAGGAVVDVATTYMGDRLSSPNDIAVRSDGTIYFTDPPYGIAPNEREVAFNGVYRVASSGTLSAEWEGAVSTRPNGVILSLDESILYVSDTADDIVRAFDVATDGSLSGERTFASVDNGDGMCMDVDGNVYVTGADSIEVFAPDGSKWGDIAVPGSPSNCTFGGAALQTLYITAGSGLYEAAMVIPGKS